MRERAIRERLERQHDDEEALRCRVIEDQLGSVTFWARTPVVRLIAGA